MAEEREPLPPGVLPNITDTNPPPLHPDTIAGPPEVVDVPYASQEGQTLSCTMGNWTGKPETYAYQWQIDDDDVGGDSSTHDVGADDAGKTAVCIVTAANDRGSTAAPPSNAVVISDNSRASRAALHSEDRHERNHRTPR